MKTLYRKYVEGTESLRDLVLLLSRLVLATLTVHVSNGFSAGDNGFEIPLYYFLMLGALLVNGSGKYSLDHLIGKRARAASPGKQ